MLSQCLLCKASWCGPSLESDVNEKDLGEVRGQIKTPLFLGREESERGREKDWFRRPPESRNYC